MHFQVTRAVTELTDVELMSEYDKRAAYNGEAERVERVELRAEITRRMAARHAVTNYHGLQAQVYR